MASSRSQRVHVAGFSWPFDRPRGRPRSDEPRSFFEKTLLFFGNQPAIQSPSQDILQETPQIFLKSTRSPERMPSEFFAKKPLHFSKIDPCSTNPLTIFYENLLGFFSNQHTVQLWLYLFFQKKNVWPVHRAHGRARKTSMIGIHMQKMIPHPTTPMVFMWNPPQSYVFPLPFLQSMGMGTKTYFHPSKIYIHNTGSRRQQKKTPKLPDSDILCQYNE